MYNMFLDGTKVTDYVGSVTMTDNIDALSKELSFKYAKNPRDKYLKDLNIQPGQKVKFYNDTTALFEGIVIEVSLDGSVKANDYGFYLNKQEVIFQASKASGSDAIRQLCSKIGISAGSICSIPTKITKVWTGSTPADIINEILESATADQGKNYFARVDGTALTVSEYPKSATVLSYHQKSGKTFDPTWSLGSVSGTKSMDALRNKVIAVQGSDTDYKILATVEDATSEAKYGTLATTVTIDDDTTKSAKSMAQSKLKELNVISEEYSIDQMLGSDDAKAGQILLFSSTKFGVSGLFLIEGVTHTYGQDESKHTMKLDVKKVVAV